MELRKCAPAIREGIDVGRPYLTAERSEVRVSEIVRHDQQDIRPFLSRFRQCCKQCQRKKSEFFQLLVLQKHTGLHVNG
jgi:hypothetical protein